MSEQDYDAADRWAESNCLADERAYERRAQESDLGDPMLAVEESSARAAEAMNRKIQEATAAAYRHCVEEGRRRSLYSAVSREFYFRWIEQQAQKADQG